MAVHSNLENGSAEAVHASRKSDTKDATRGAVTSIPSRPTPLSRTRIKRSYHRRGARNASR
jgi:hypothetical protein